MFSCGEMRKNERQQFNDLKSNHLFTSNKEILPGSLISGVQALPKEQQATVTKSLLSKTTASDSHLYKRRRNSFLLGLMEDSFR